MVTAPQVSFCFICDVHFWRQVWRLLPHHFPNLHNTKTLISWERKKICQKVKRHFFVFFKSLQISSNFFSFHRHFMVFELVSAELYLDTMKLLTVGKQSPSKLLSGLKSVKRLLCQELSSKWNWIFSLGGTSHGSQGLVRACPFGCYIFFSLG